MSGADTVLLFIRVLVSLAVVLGIIWAAARYVKRQGQISSSGEIDVRVVARRALGRRGSVAVVEACGRTYLIGVTDTQVGLVADLTDSAREQAAVLEDARIAVSVGGGELGEHIPIDLSSLQPAHVVADRASLLDSLRALTARRVP